METNQLHSERPGSILCLEKGSRVKARVQSRRADGALTDRHIEIELLEDLFLNYAKRKHAFLERCKCHIPILKQDATSLNHAYTLISTEFESHRLAKGGNVFNKLHIANNAGGLEPLDVLRQRLLDSLQRTADVDSSDPPDSYHDLSQISETLNSTLYNEPLFVKLIHKLVDRCAKEHYGIYEYKQRCAAGAFFTFYQYVFGQFRSSLHYMALDELIYRWSCELDQFIHGAWSGYFLNEVESMAKYNQGFTEMICGAAYSGDAKDKFDQIDRWIQERT